MSGSGLMEVVSVDNIDRYMANISANSYPSFGWVSVDYWLGISQVLIDTSADMSAGWVFFE